MIEKIERNNDTDFYFDYSRNIPGVDTRPHYHKTYEIYFLKKGSCGYYLDNRFFALMEGDLIFIPGGTVHQTVYKKGTHSRYLINCGDSYIPSDILGEISVLDPVFRVPEMYKEINEIFDAIDREHLTKDKYSDQMIKCQTSRLFYLLARHQSENLISRDSNKTVESVVKYIKENYMNDISLTDVAVDLAVSPEHLSRIFKREIGVGFNEYLNSFRLQKAEFMLKNEVGKSISEVAFSCGFNDSNYFSYRFKKAYGITPKQIKHK